MYRLGTEVVRFRYYAELNYVDAGALRDAGTDEPEPIPDIVGVCFRRIVEGLAALTDGPSIAENVSVCAATLRTAAQKMSTCLKDAWMSDDHRDRIRWYQHMSDRSDGGNDPSLQMQVLQGVDGDEPSFAESPLAPRAWDPFQGAADALAESFTPLYRALFDLSRVLSSVVHQRPSDYDAERGGLRAFDLDYLQLQVSPYVTRLMQAVCRESDVLNGLRGRLAGKAPDKSASRLHKKILTRLRRGRFRPVPTVTERAISAIEPTSPPADAMPPISVTPDSFTQTTVSPVLPQHLRLAPDLTSVTTSPSHPALAAERRKQLQTYREHLDPAEQVVGMSDAILEIFGQIHECSVGQFRVVLLLGPTGAGKTAIARLLHTGRTWGHDLTSAAVILHDLGRDATHLSLVLEGLRSLRNKHTSRRGIVATASGHWTDRWSSRAVRVTLEVLCVHRHLHAASRHSGPSYFGEFRIGFTALIRISSTGYGSSSVSRATNGGFGASLPLVMRRGRDDRHVAVDLCDQLVRRRHEHVGDQQRLLALRPDTPEACEH